MSPRFSIIIPARNEECFIGRCLDSIRVAAASNHRRAADLFYYDVER